MSQVESILNEGFMRSQEFRDSSPRT